MDESRKGRVCVVGSINMDLVVRAGRLPAVGETVLGGRFEQHPGGKGANQAVAAARLGAGVELVGAVGDDAHGEAMLDAMREQRVSLDYVETRPGAATGVALITTEVTGENTIVVASGANAEVSPQQIDRCRDAIESCAVTLAVLEVPVETCQHAAEIAAACGAMFVLNAAPAMHLPASLLRRVDVLVANQMEAAVLSDHTGADLGTVGRAVLALGPKYSIVTLGAGGVLIDDHENGMRRIPAIDVAPVDTVGAGDCFCGALAARLSLGDDIDAAARFACVAAGLATTRPGAISGMPSLREVQERLRATGRPH